MSQDPHAAAPMTRDSLLVGSIGIDHGEGGRCRKRTATACCGRTTSRHRTKEPEKTLEFLKHIEAEGNRS